MSSTQKYLNTRTKQISHVDGKGKREGRPANWLCDCAPGNGARPNNMHYWWMAECHQCGIARPVLAWQLPRARRPLRVEEGRAVHRARGVYAAIAVALIFVVVLTAFVIGLLL